MKQESSKNSVKTTGHKNCLFDVHNDELMIELGIRPPHFSSRDESVWTKTQNEKRLLKHVRDNREKIHFNIAPRKVIPVKAKLIIYLKKNTEFSNTTYSTECWQHEINDILFKYHKVNKNTGKEESLISKYVYNGKTYSPGQKPFWP